MQRLEVSCAVRFFKSLGFNGLRHEVFEALRISRQSAHEGGKAVNPTHQQPLPPTPEDNRGTHFR